METSRPENENLEKAKDPKMKTLWSENENLKNQKMKTLWTKNENLKIRKWKASDPKMKS